MTRVVPVMEWHRPARLKIPYAFTCFGSLSPMFQEYADRGHREIALWAQPLDERWVQPALWNDDVLDPSERIEKVYLPVQEIFLLCPRRYIVAGPKELQELQRVHDFKWVRSHAHA
jgi:hypothetical protein